MIRMLVADDAAHLLRPIILLRGLARQVGKTNHPAEPGFGAILAGGDHAVGAIEGAGHDLDPRAIDMPKAQWRAAILAKVTLGDRGRTEGGRLAAGPGEVALFDLGKGGEWSAGGLLAHAAMANTDCIGRG